MELETRFLGPACELRVDEADNSHRMIRGYAAVFNSRSEDFGGWREIVLPGAFGESLKDGSDVRALVDHNSSLILGRNKAGTLRLAEDKRGLAVEIDAPDTTVGRDTVVSIRRHDLTGMSFAFRTIDADWVTEDGQEIRRLKNVELVDVSVVAYPAYADTAVAVRSLESWRKRVEFLATRRLNRARLQLAEAEV